MATTTHPMAHTMVDGQVISEETALNRPLLKSIVTAQIAGLITALAFIVLFALFQAENALYPIQVIGSFILGETALQGLNFAAVIVGVLIHQLVIAMVIGLAYGLIAKSTPITTYSKALLIGLGLGVVSMIGPYIIYPAVMNAAHGADLWNMEIPILYSWITYLIMGASFVLYPKVAEKLDAADADRVNSPRADRI